MKMRKLALAAALAIGLSQAAGAAYAQTKIFVVDEAKVRAGSKIGQEIASKLGDIQKQGVDKLGLEQLSKDIKTEGDALQPQTASLTPEALSKDPALKSRVDALGRKEQEFLQKRDSLTQALNQQESGAMQAFAAAMGPAVEYVGKEAGADVVLSSSSTWYFKNTVDLSAKVVARMDATTPSLSSLQAANPAPAAGAAPAAPKPAVPKATKPPG